MLKASLPEEYKSKYRRVNPPPDFFRFNNIGRNRILRCVQNHYDPVTPTPATNKFLNFFRVLSNLDGYWDVQTQFRGAKFAYPKAGYSQNDNTSELYAAAHIIQWGWMPEFHNKKNTQCFTYSLERKEAGILVTVSHPTSFNQRLQRACEAALQERSLTNPARKSPLKIRKDVEAKAFQAFYTLDGLTASLTASYKDYITTNILEFVSELFNALNDPDGAPTINIPQVNEPEDVLYDCEFFLPYDSFIFADNAKYRRPGAASDVMMAAQELLGDVAPGTIVTRADLIELGVSKSQILSWQKYEIFKPIPRPGRLRYFEMWPSSPLHIKPITSNLPPISIEVAREITIAAIKRPADLDDLQRKTAKTTAKSDAAVSLVSITADTMSKKIPLTWLDAATAPVSSAETFKPTIAQPAPEPKPNMFQKKSGTKAKINPKPKFTPRIKTTKKGGS